MKLEIVVYIANIGKWRDFVSVDAKVLLREVSPLPYIHNVNGGRQFRSSNSRHIQSSATRRCIFLCVCACVDYCLHVDQLAFQSHSNPHLQSALRFWCSGSYVNYKFGDQYLDEWRLERLPVVRLWIQGKETD